MPKEKKKTLNDGATAVSETSGEHIGWENQHVFYCFHGISVWLLGRNNSFLQLSWCSCRVWSCFWGDFREVGALVASRLNTKRRGNNFVKQETSTVKGCGCGYRFTFIYCKNSLNYHHYIFIYIYKSKYHKYIRTFVVGNSNFLSSNNSKPYIINVEKNTSSGGVKVKPNIQTSSSSRLNKQSGPRYHQVTLPKTNVAPGNRPHPQWFRSYVSSGRVQLRTPLISGWNDPSYHHLLIYIRPFIAVP